MKTTPFDPSADLILVPARVQGPTGRSMPLRVALDTGSSETVVTPEFIDRIGYSPHVMATR